MMSKILRTRWWIFLIIFSFMVKANAHAESLIKRQPKYYHANRNEFEEKIFPERTSLQGNWDLYGTDLQEAHVWTGYLIIDSFGEVTEGKLKGFLPSQQYDITGGHFDLDIKTGKVIGFFSDSEGEITNIEATASCCFVQVPPVIILNRKESSTIIRNYSICQISGVMFNASGREEGMCILVKTGTIPIKTKLVAEWNMNEGSGDMLYDSSGNNHHGKTYGNPSWGEGALCFDGLDDWVNIPDSDSFTFDNNLSVKARVWPDTTSGILTIIRQHKQTGEDEGWLLRINSGRLEGAVKIDGNLYIIDGKSVLSITEYSTVAMVWSDNLLKLYVNGQLDNSIATTGTGINSVASITIGRLAEDYSSEYFDGCIDKVAVYKK